ncbi:carboxymuconolactone decarboxylase family protein [Aquitalea sp.]|uniref:(R)-mandelonitrile lyase n=1 Tax=Aquitalea sp. TaxID=1872623 RepID=UPI0025841E02|nr:carboxymuconolactone decarboxylase family protein [Aquitalea sp.]
MMSDWILMKSIFGGLICVLLFNSAWAATQAGEDSGPASTDISVLARISPQSSRPVVIAAPDHFTGRVRVAPLFSATASTHASGAYVTFEPGARTDWHSHPAGQTLVITAGSGFVQFWGGPVQSISVGDVVWIPPGQKHWHGASRNEAMTHLAIQEQVEGSTVSWMEKVSQQQYGAAGGTQSPAPASRAQQLMGDIAPKLADLTDSVLYQDIWERPGLSKRDRSLVTVSALIALNRPDQLRSHLVLALKNGVTAEELSETITHMAFYAGWPSAVSAITAAREVLSKEAGHPTASEPPSRVSPADSVGPASTPAR